MAKRKNLVHQKLKNANPHDLISFQVKLPAYLMSDVKRYGDSAKVIKTALELARKEKFKFGLLEIISEIRRQIELLEIWENNDMEMKDKIDEKHLSLLNSYRHVYFILKDSVFLNRRRSY